MGYAVLFRMKHNVIIETISLLIGWNGYGNGYGNGCGNGIHGMLLQRFAVAKYTVLAGLAGALTS